MQLLYAFKNVIFTVVILDSSIIRMSFCSCYAFKKKKPDFVLTDIPGTLIRGIDIITKYSDLDISEW